MANKKFTELTATTTLADTDILPVVTDPAGSPTTKKITLSNLKAEILDTPTVTGTMTTAGINATGTVSATLFSGSGASLTSIPAAQLTGTLPAISGVNLTNLNASNLASGTVSTSRLPSSYSALTITTLTSTSATGLQYAQGNGGSTNVKVYLDPFAAGVTRFLEFGNGVACITASAPTASDTKYVNCYINGAEYRIKMESTA